MPQIDWAAVAVVITLAAQTGAFIWWASKTDTTQKNLQDGIDELKDNIKEVASDVKQHIRDDRDFQVDVSEKLGAISPTIPGRRDH